MTPPDRAEGAELILSDGQRVTVIREHPIRYDKDSSIDGKAAVEFVAVWVTPRGEQ